MKHHYAGTAPLLSPVSKSCFLWRPNTSAMHSWFVHVVSAVGGPAGLRCCSLVTVATAIPLSYHGHTTAIPLSLLPYLMLHLPRSGISVTDDEIAFGLFDVLVVVVCVLILCSVLVTSEIQERNAHMALLRQQGAYGPSIPGAEAGKQDGTVQKLSQECEELRQRVQVL